MFQFRPYQESAIKSVCEDLKEHNKVGAILPTAGGKTEIFIGVATQFLAENPDKSVLILSHLSLLTTQTRDRFKLRAPHIRVGILQADTRPAPDSHVVISTMQSSRVEGKAFSFNEKSYRKVGLIVVDECHYLTTESYETAIGHFPGAKIFGVTATPFREKRLMTSYFDKISFSISMQELINDGYLVKPDLIQINADNKDDEDVIAMVSRIYQEKEKGSKAIVFMRTIEDAKAMRNTLENVGIKSHAVTSELTGEHRDEVLDGFKDNDTMVLTTVNVLTAGFDAPCVSAIFMPYPTDSPTLYMQRIGRGLRTFPGKTNCRIYVMGNTPSISRGTYETVHRHALNGTAEWKDYDNLRDDLLYNLDSDPKYSWTERIVEIANRMEAIGVNDVAAMLVEKKFPKKFMENLDKLQSFMVKASIETPVNNRMATAAQKDAMSRYGFDKEAVDKLTNYEASVVLSAVKMMYRDQGEFVVQSGKMAGRHVKDLPFFYKKTILEKFPHSGVANLIRQWEVKKYG